MKQGNLGEKFVCPEEETVKMCGGMHAVAILLESVSRKNAKSLPLLCSCKSAKKLCLQNKKLAFFLNSKQRRVGHFALLQENVSSKKPISSLK